MLLEVADDSKSSASGPAQMCTIHTHILSYVANLSQPTLSHTFGVEVIQISNVMNVGPAQL